MYLNNMEPSKSWKFNSADFSAWLNNSLVFLAPLAVVYFGFVQANLQDGFSFSDFAPNDAVVGAFVLYIVNTATDFFRKLAKDNTPKG